MKDTCEINCIHPEKVEKVKRELLSEDISQMVAGIFKVLGDSTRVKIINALLKEELCVCDLSNLLNMSQSAISHQLRVLRHMKIVKHRKEGKVVYYSLDDEHILNLFEQCLKHVKHSGIKH